MSTGDPGPVSALSLSDLPSQQEQPRRRAREQDRRNRRRRRRRRTALVLLTCMVLFGGALFAVYSFARPVVEGFFEPKDYPGPGSGTVQVQIAAGDSGRAIGQTLQEADVVKTAGAFVDAASSEPKAASIQPGTYELKEHMSAKGALALLLDPASRISVRIAVPEGLHVAQVLERMEEASGVQVPELKKALQDPAVGLPPEAKGNAEGYLFPATYTFEPDTKPVEMFAAMVKRYTAAMDELKVPADQRRTVLIKASLIEEEAQRPEDFGKVSRVIDNRLAKKMPLQFDSTVNFATGKTGITTTKQDRALDSPYNTYKYPGLPPGPIDSPGEAAMAAAMDPTPGDWLFFVTVNPDTGETKFAATGEEHAQYVKEFQQWLRDHNG